MSDEPLHESTDAMRWAEEFVAMHGGDVGLMLAWFANAIEAGRSAGLKIARAEEREGWRREREVLINRCTVLEQQRDAARAEEREACAKCCDPWIGFSDGSEFVQIQESAATQIAAAIRARREG